MSTTTTNANAALKATWTKFNDCWMVRVEGDVIIDGHVLEFEVTKKDGTNKTVQTLDEPEWSKDGVAIYCPMGSTKHSYVAERNRYANARAEGAIIRNGSVYYI